MRGLSVYSSLQEKQIHSKGKCSRDSACRFFQPLVLFPSLGSVCFSSPLCPACVFYSSSSPGSLPQPTQPRPPTPQPQTNTVLPFSPKARQQENSTTHISLLTGVETISSAKAGEQKCFQKQLFEK